MADTDSSPRISKVNPNEQIVAKSYIGSAEERAKLYSISISDAEGYWAEIAESFHWNKKWTGRVRAFNYNASSGPIFISWYACVGPIFGSLFSFRFAGAETNICFNALDRHVSSGKGEKVAFIYEGNDGESSRITYQELLDQTCQLANVLKKHGVKAGDKVWLIFFCAPFFVCFSIFR